MMADPGRPFGLYCREEKGPSRWSTYRELDNAVERAVKIHGRGSDSYVVDERTEQIVWDSRTDAKPVDAISLDDLDAILEKEDETCPDCGDVHAEGDCIL